MLIILWFMRGVCHLSFFYWLVNRHCSMRHILVASISFTFLLFVFLRFYSYPEINIIALLVFLLFLGYLSKIPLRQSLYGAFASIVIITVILNLGSELLYQLYLYLPFAVYLWTPQLLNFLFIILFIFFLWYSRYQISTISNVVRHSRFFVMTNVLLMLCTFLLLIVNYPAGKWLRKWHQQYAEKLYLVIITCTLVLLVLLIIYMSFAREQLKLQHEKIQQQQLLAYTKELETLHDELATFRHDYANILASLEQSIHAGNMMQIRHVYQQTIAPTKEIVNQQSLEVVKLRNVSLPEVKSLIITKLFEAEKRQLNIVLDIPEVIATLPISSHHFIRMLSILLDNAIQAAEESPPHQVQLSLFFTATQFHVVVKNNTAQVIGDLTEIYEKRYSTNSSQRGYGLFSLKHLLMQHPNAMLSTKIEQHYFIQHLLFTNRS